MKGISLPFAQTVKNFLPLKDYFLRNRWRLLFGFFSLLLVDFLQLLIPLVIKNPIDLMTKMTATALMLLQQGGLILLIAFTTALLRYVWRLLIFGAIKRHEKSRA